MASNDEQVRARLERWRAKLLDLGKRNQLINFKPRRTSTVQIVDELPSEVFRRLVIDRKPMSFAAIPEPGSTSTRDDDERGLAAVDYEEYDPAGLESRHLDTVLQTTLPETKLSTNLIYIERQASAAIEEQGYNILYLTLGILEWYEAPTSDVKLQAPIMLIPVQLQRESASRPFQLAPYDDDPIVNPSLARRLDTEFGIAMPALPDDYEGWDPQSVFTDLAREIASVDVRWKITNDIYLGLYSFSKYLMYKDLEAHAAAFASAPLIQQLCGVEEGRPSVETFDHDLDKYLQPHDVFQILDADSSQQEAILRVKAGQSLVIEGPPGTGKSQTIANIIAECLADGRSVLFVSEKMAALEVVYNRLSQAGLGDFCLELHSRKANKRDVAYELGRALEVTHPQPEGWEEDLRRLTQLRDQLDAYADSVHEPFGALGLSPFAIFGTLAPLRDLPGVAFPLPDAAEWTRAQLEQRLDILGRLAASWRTVGDPLTHPWRGSRLKELPYETTVAIPEMLDTTLSSLRILHERGAGLASLCSVASPTTIDEALELTTFAETLAQAPAASADVLLNPAWNSLDPEVESIISDGETHSAALPRFSQHFKESLTLDDVRSLVEGQNRYGRNPFRFLSNRFRADRRLLKRHLQRSYKIRRKTLLADLQHAQTTLELATRLNEYDRGAALFGDRWRGPHSDWADLRSFASWVVSYRRQLVRNVAREATAQLIETGALRRAEVERARADLLAAATRLRPDISSLCDVTKLDEEEAFSTRVEILDLSALQDRLKEMLSGLAELDAWARYNADRHDVIQSGLGDFVDALSAHAAAYDILTQAFTKHFYSVLLDKAMTERPALKRFDGGAHAAALTEFRALDKKQLAIGRERVRAALATRLPNPMATSSAVSEVGLIKREARKQRRHISIRKLFESAPNAISRIKPCLMMSPLSVAQFLDPTKASFDVVIFDEASQVAPEDAIGALARGRQLVMVGDNKQLPPTDFFNRQVDTDDEGEDDDLPGDLQSILDECATVMPGTMLRWHYRSLHESLIAFSNHNFYDGSLHTFPSPTDRAEGLGVIFSFVDDGIYDSGKSRTNRIEARRAAEHVVKILREEPELSVGVGTFSQAQQMAILDVLEEFRRDDRGLDARFSYEDPEHVFVKNLENIQGDERDVIVLSVGYGRDADGRFLHNFGPLNTAGGDRRLNVLVTRARRRLIVFSSIKAEDIDLSRTQARGAALLKQYLAFAERGDEALYDVADGGGGWSDSDFEEDVYRALASRGLNVRKQVGCSSYRIDLAIVDPERSGRYLLGIECDGAAYHSSRTARDRDRLRQQVLESLGWTIHRIWSTDWFKNPSREVERVVEALGKARPPAPPGAKRSVTSASAKESRPTAPRPVSGGAVASRAALQTAQPYIAAFADAGSPERFYDAPIREIAESVSAVVHVESPIHLDELTRRVARNWGFDRAGSVIASKVRDGLEAARRQGTVKVRGKFAWVPDMSVPSVRSRAVDGAPKIPDLIACEEFAEAAMVVLRRELGLPEDELVRLTGRLMGFDRVASQLSLSIREGIQALLRDGRAVVEQGRVALGGGNLSL